MNEKNSAWLMFEITGRVEDYLKYCEYKENADGLQNRRNSIEPEEGVSKQPKIFDNTDQRSWLN